ncbi:MAG TPA: MFS transporter [Thauera sp.]|uniref:MFS transporter n=1 Tax=Thauera sp. TaxID=1905334 RepID=UPI002C05602C|nr:MFS transporter [Thauera sp.]HRP24628.1 MFS transporter [Thauera sp.]HRP64727.1 MFS transporter [Thauera sp.]
MFIGGFATFALVYCTQPLLPLLAAEFGVSAASASLSVSATTAGLALMLIPGSVLADRLGRQQLMKFALAIAAVLALATAFAPDFFSLLVLRALLGAVLAGLPAAAMAYIGEEVTPNAQARAMGLYIAGNALGGMSGRFVGALVTDWSSWRTALAVIGVFGLVSAVVFWRRLPASRHFVPRAATPARIFRDALAIYRDPGLPWLFLVAFLAMGAFVGLYNFLGFRLLEQPYALGQSAIGAIFLLYLVGTWASALSGRLAERQGRPRVLWLMVVVMGSGLALTLAQPLWLIIAGVGVFTFGFFAAHALASGWVGRRAGERRALASALYLSSYYLGASVIGSLAGTAWTAGHWGGLSALLGACVLATLGVGLYLRRLPT